uniref:Vomeronasal type-1 receptor n=2 Tax=Nannospalax galili TaxID=1026970 RepID=A0A4Y1N5Q7_NANGA|nr:vomeronasal type 1 receptor 6 [Nannospalax galili]AWV49467.1 vomeronasal type 1 receptor 6 [Nannospalax galili]AWV49468.1 vomeronasal type 1 receptor 6 [Nannospalax galili]AWV49469.1 vomeronasal type 1 receptor 6 [Nannospalax galili]AWV49471.1 vomeronasal type 1 receptor 6 [Nannospalax galili]
MHLAVGNLFLSQTTMGILGNFSLLSYYLDLFYNECILKPTDLILTQLFIANSLIIISRGVPHTMTAFGMKWFFNNFVCKLLLFVDRVGRSVSIRTTCLLNVVQAITISPRNSCWKGLKVKGIKYVSLSISLCWLLYSRINMTFPLYIYTKGSHRNMTDKRNFNYCSNVGHDKVIDSVCATLVVFPEIVFSMIIIWSSSSMIIILYRHKQQAQHILSSHVLHKTSPKSRATQNILLLVASFLTFYTLSAMLQGCIAVLYVLQPFPGLLEIRAGFPPTGREVWLDTRVCTCDSPCPFFAEAQIFSKTSCDHFGKWAKLSSAGCLCLTQRTIESNKCWKKHVQTLN